MPRSTTHLILISALNTDTIPKNTPRRLKIKWCRDLYF